MLSRRRRVSLDEMLNSFRTDWNRNHFQNKFCVQKIQIFQLKIACKNAQNAMIYGLKILSKKIYVSIDKMLNLFQS